MNAPRPATQQDQQTRAEASPGPADAGDSYELPRSHEEMMREYYPYLLDSHPAIAADRFQARRGPWH